MLVNWEKRKNGHPLKEEYVLFDYAQEEVLIIIKHKAIGKKEMTEEGQDIVINNARIEDTITKTGRV